MKYLKYLIYTGIVSLFYSPCFAQPTGKACQHIWPKSILANFSDMQFVSETVWVAIDEASGIYRSDDSGHHWQKLAVPCSTPILCAHFINTQTGLVGTANGQILRTADGGVSWQVVYHDTVRYRAPFDTLGKPLQWKQFVAVNRQDIFLMAHYRYVFYSSNHGRTWKRYDTEFTTAELFRIQFVSRKVGYIFANKILLKTTNGGVKWKVVNPTSMRFSFAFRGKTIKTAYDIFFWNNRYAFYKINGNNALCYSIDGGQHWNIREAHYYDTTGKPIEIPKDGYGWPSSNLRAAFADSLFGSMGIDVPGGGKRFIGYTNDGGRSVRQIPGLVSNETNTQLLCYNPKGDNFVLQQANQELLVIDRQMRVQKLLGPFPPYSRWPNGQIAAIDSHHFIVSQYEQLHKDIKLKLLHFMDDSAYTDSVPYLLGDKFGKKPMLQIVNKRLWYSLAAHPNYGSSIGHNGYKQLVRTNDMGTSWEVLLWLQEHPEMGTWICDYQVLDTLRIYLLTFNEMTNQHQFWKSTNGGIQWTLVKADVTNLPTLNVVLADEDMVLFNQMYVMDFWDAQQGLIAISEEHILRTSDGGQSWQHQRLFEAETKKGLQMIDPGQLSLALLPNGQGHILFTPSTSYKHAIIYQTTNYGAEWKRDTIVKSEFWTIRKSPNSSAYLLPYTYKGDKQVYQTTNAGQSWEPFELCQTAAPIIDMDFYSPTGGFALDGNGNVYRFKFP